MTFRIFLLSSLIAFAGVATDFIDGLPNGVFVGHGAWEDNYGRYGDYDVYVEIIDNEMNVDYKWADGEAFYSFDFWFNGPGLFEVGYDGIAVGNGYCDPFECHYQVVLEGAEIFESLHFDPNVSEAPVFFKIGHKQIGDRLISWQDSLTYLDSGEGEIEQPIVDLPPPLEDVVPSDPSQQEPSDPAQQQPIEKDPTEQQA